MARTSKGFCADSRASSGHNEENTRTFQGQKKTKRTCGDKPRTSQVQKTTSEGQPLRESPI